MTVPADYGSPAYWDERYAAADGTFDWYMDWKALKPHLLPFLSTSPTFEILVPGCGTSTLGPSLYDSGYTNVTNVDSSPVAVSKMNDLYADRTEMEFACMDARSLEYLPDGCFDLIVDKGLSDALLCSPQNLIDLKSSISEFHRVLKPDGVLLVVSHGVPATRMTHLTGKGTTWGVEFKKVAKGGGGHEGEGFYYFYICRKPKV